MAFPFPEAMLGRNGPTERDGAPGELGHQSTRTLPFFIVRRKHIDVKVRVADVAEDHIAAGKLALQILAIIRQHLAIARHRHGVIGIHFERAGAADSIVHELR